MNEYTVRARRWEHGWELDIEGVGVTQSPSLAGADRMVRSYLALDGHKDAYRAALTFEYPDYERLVGKTQTLQRRAEQATELAARASRDLVQSLSSAGLKGAEIAAVMRVSPQRVSQLLPKGRGARDRRPPALG